VPTVHSLDEFFHRKYEEDESGRLIKVKSAEQVIEELGFDANIHMPSPSYWPIVVAFSLPVIALGVIYLHVIMVVGLAIFLGGVYGWVMEPSAEDHGDHGGPSASTQELAHVG
jgi:cytochrome c oxidase subunit 1